MLFFDINGKLIQIDKNDFKNDKIYYEKIMEIKLSFVKTEHKNNQNNKNNQYSTYIIEKNYV